jgi:glucokinase
MLGRCRPARPFGDITDATGGRAAHRQGMELILAGDIGGTKTRLGLFEPRGSRPVAAETFSTAGYEHPAELITAFLAATRARPTQACLGIAAPVHGGVAESVKLPWPVEAAELERRLGLPAVELVNDVEANARGISALEERDLVPLQPGAPGAAGTRAVVSAGSGLGEAAIWWDGAAHRPGASEGGSCSFAPRTELEIELLRFLTAETGRVSVGQVCSGPGLQNVYRFLSGEREAPPPAAIAAEAEANRSSAASAAIDVLVSIYGARRPIGMIAVLRERAVGGSAPARGRDLADGRPDDGMAISSRLASARAFLRRRRQPVAGAGAGGAPSASAPAPFPLPVAAAAAAAASAGKPTICASAW